MSYSRLNNESGMVMLVVMVISFLGSILMASYMSFVIQESKHSIWQKERVQSIFLAESGIQKGLYYLNEHDAPDNPWSAYIDKTESVFLADEEQIPEYTGTEIYDSKDSYAGYYKTSLHNRFVDENNMITKLPPRYFLIKSTGTIGRSIPINHSMSVIAAKVSGISAPAALCIYDNPDPEKELSKFDSNVWIVSGVDIDNPFGNTGIYGVAVSNAEDNIKGEDGQFGKRLDQVQGIDGDGNYVHSDDAILEDNGLPKNLNELVAYFMPMSTDISGYSRFEDSHLGSPDNYQIIYANLSQGNLKMAAQTTGYGVLILSGTGEFEMAGNSSWYGIILCAKGSNISLKGGGNTPAHIFGSLMIDDGVMEMNGTGDVRYSSEALAEIDRQLVAYRVMSWCDGWGKQLGRFN